MKPSVRTFPVTAVALSLFLLAPARASAQHTAGGASSVGSAVPAGSSSSGGGGSSSGGDSCSFGHRGSPGREQQSTSEPCRPGRRKQSGVHELLDALAGSCVRPSPQRPADRRHGGSEKFSAAGEQRERRRPGVHRGRIQPLVLRVRRPRCVAILWRLRSFCVRFRIPDRRWNEDIAGCER